MRNGQKGNVWQEHFSADEMCKLTLDQYLSKGSYGWQVVPFDNFFQMLNRQGHTHILTKIREKNRVLSGICPFDK